MDFRLTHFALWVIIILLLLALFTLFQNPGRRTNALEISLSQFLNEVEQGRVRDVLIQGPEVLGTYTDGRVFQTYVPNDPSLIQRLTGKGVAVTLRPHESATPLFVSLLASWLPFIALIGVWISLSRQMQSGRRWTLTSHNEIDDIKRRLSELQSRIDELINKDKK